ncbi:MAG TPA: IS91 family transposase [Candidatus Udaeobacter sp.]|nr:IS91 family transposase [Candidatus Udaeobacter sp.]
MPEVADIIRLHGAAYCEQSGVCLSSVQKLALRDIAACRTPFFGGHVHQCDHCQEKVFSYHSCRNRSCPKCHQDQTERWIEKQRGHLLSCSYFLVTFTLPAELRSLARSHPRKIYSLLMKAAADALQKLANDPRYLGARIGALAVLHTWTRAMLFHPHVHILVTAGGLSSDTSTWIDSKHPCFLVPVRALSMIFRAKFCAGLKKAGLLEGVPPSLWKKPWVVHCQPAGRGDKVLDYLGRYVFRIAIANSRIESIDNGQVRFRYRDNQTQQTRRVTLPAREFIGRFLQHVLPRGCVKVRYYGIWSPSRRPQLQRAQTLLSPNRPADDSTLPLPIAESVAPLPAPHQCPLCHRGVLILLQTLPAQRSHSP